MNRPRSASEILASIYDAESGTIKTQTSSVNLDNVYLDVNMDASDGDSVAVSDGSHTLDINADGSINVRVAETAAVVNAFEEVSNVENGSEVDVLEYTLPSQGKLQRVHVSGTNVARYDVLINSNIQDRKYTNWFSLSSNFEFGDGIQVGPGEIVKVKVWHTRPNPGNFNARIQIKYA